MKYSGFDVDKGEQWCDWCCDKLRQSIPNTVDFFKPDKTFVIFETCTPPEWIGDPSGSHRQTPIK